MAIGAYAIERDYSHYVAHASKTVLALVGTATKGPINEPTAITSTQDLVNKFGALNINCPALYAAQYFLNQASKLYYVRAAGEDAAPGYVEVKGINTTTSEVTAVTFEMLEKGTFCKDYKMYVTNGSVSGTYNFTLKTSNGTTIEVLENKAYGDLHEGDTFDVVKIRTVDPLITSLVLGTYAFTNGVDGFDNPSIIAAAATTTIPGKDSSEESISEAIKVEMLTAGISYNDYTLTLATVSEGYKLTLKDSDNVVRESITLAEITQGIQTDYFKITLVSSSAETFTDGTYTFVGGHDDVASKYVNAAKTLTSESLDISLIAVPGVSDREVIVPVSQIAETRGDCLYIIDPPRGLTIDGVVHWINGEGSYEQDAKINSSYAAVYYDYVKIYDPVNKTNLIVPPSVPVCAMIAYSARISELWFAPAGLTRGLISGVISTETHLNRNDVELLYENNINSIYEDSQVGLVVWGQKTLFREATALNRVNVRQLMNYLKKVVVAACNYLVFEPNDRVTWNMFEMRITPTLQSIQAHRGIYEYKIVKGETIVTPDDIDNYRMPCMIMIRPTKAAEEIPVYFVLTSTGADFNTVLEANGIVEL